MWLSGSQPDASRPAGKWRRRLLLSLSQFRNMDTAIVTGLTGIFGSLLGGSASVATAWVTQRTSNKRKEFHAELTGAKRFTANLLTNAQHARWIR